MLKSESFMGFTFDGEMFVCDKCGYRCSRGIMPISIHWNECINEGKLLNDLLSEREIKGQALAITDLKNILPDD